MNLSAELCEPKSVRCLFSRWVRFYRHHKFIQKSAFSQGRFNSRILMTCRSVANDRFSVWKLGITHVLNAAHGKMHCQGSHEFYGSTVEYYGVPADDSPSFNLSVYFHPCADYIKEVLSSPGGKTIYCLSLYLLHPKL